jgi:Zn-dependent peptidase ImmA (M78 family)
MSEPISYNSEFLPEITIAVVFSDNSQYVKLIPFFEEYGYGFLVPNKNLVVIDGENIIDNFNSDVLKFIEAHEISHILLGHDGPRNQEEEMDADLGAYILLKKKGKEESINHLLDNFEDRHGIKFDESLLKRVKNHFS